MNHDMKFTESTTVYKFYVNFEFILPLFIYMILKEIIKKQKKKKSLFGVLCSIVYSTN